MNINDKLYNEYRLHYLMCKKTLERLKSDNVITSAQYDEQLKVITNTSSNINDALVQLKKNLEYLRGLYIETYKN